MTLAVRHLTRRVKAPCTVENRLTGTELKFISAWCIASPLGLFALTQQDLKNSTFSFSPEKIHLIWRGSVFTLVRRTSTALVASHNKTWKSCRTSISILSCPKAPYINRASPAPRDCSSLQPAHVIQWKSEVLRLAIPMEGKTTKEDSHGPLSCRLPLGSPALILLSQHLLERLSSLILSKRCLGKRWWERAQMQCSKLRHKQNQNK